MMRVKSGFFIVFSLFFTFSLFSQNGISIERASLDSLVSILSKKTGNIYYYPNDSLTIAELFSISSSEDKVVENIIRAIESKGYSISIMDNRYFILKGVGIFPGNFDKLITGLDYSNSENKYQEAIRNNVTDAIVLNKIYEIGDKNSGKEQKKASINGTVRDTHTGEPLIGVTLYSPTNNIYASTDQYGSYSILLPTGESELVCSGYSLEDMRLNVIIYSDGEFNITMREKVETLLGATISAESYNKIKRSEIGLDVVRIERIRHVPVVFGESDILKVIQTLPGVKTVGEASTGFNVRGGSTDQNLILFNEGTIYNPSHLFGLFSAFNSDVVKDIELYKSSIPAQYGGRISSVLEVNGREGNNKKITGSLGVGLLTGRAHIEGPIIKDRTFFIAALRTTYSNWLLNLLPEESGYKNGTASFRDFNLGLSHQINNNNSIYAYAYHSQDSFNFNIDTCFNYTNSNFSVKWRSVLSGKHNMNTSIGYDNYQYNNIDNSNPFAAYKLSFRIKQYFLKSHFRYLINPNHSLSYGVSTLLYDLSPGSFQPLTDESLVISRNLEREKALESAVYLSDNWNITNNLQLDAGIRYSFFNSLSFTPDNNAFYHGPEIRISARYLINFRTSVKVGFNSMRQYIHMLTNTTSISPTDTWRLSNKMIEPQTGWQIAAGFYRTMLNTNLELSLEAYYKKIEDYLDYKGGATLIMNQNIADDIIRTKGRAVGVELMLKKNSGRLNGWISYTLSSIQFKQKDLLLTSSAINKGNWYNAHYDKPHDLKVVANYKLTQRYSLSLNMDYSTGRPVTIPLGKYFTNGGYRIYYSERNQYRIPDYFRTDFAVNIEPSHNITHLAHFTITVGVYNLTGRKNPYSVYYDFKNGSINGHMLTIFGAPIPYINLNIRF